MSEFIKKLLAENSDISFMRFACGVLLGVSIVVIGFITVAWYLTDRDPSKLSDLVKFLVGAAIVGKAGQKFAETK